MPGRPLSSNPCCHPSTVTGRRPVSPVVARHPGFTFSRTASSRLPAATSILRCTGESTVSGATEGAARVERVLSPGGRSTSAAGANAGELRTLTVLSPRRRVSGGAAAELSGRRRHRDEVRRPGGHGRPVGPAVHGHVGTGPAGVGHRLIGHDGRQVGTTAEAQLADPDPHRGDAPVEAEAGHPLGLLDADGQPVGADRREARATLRVEPHGTSSSRPAQDHDLGPPRRRVGIHGEVESRHPASTGPPDAQGGAHVVGRGDPGRPRVSVDRGVRRRPHVPDRPATRRPPGPGDRARAACRGRSRAGAQRSGWPRSRPGKGAARCAASPGPPRWAGRDRGRSARRHPPPRSRCVRPGTPAGPPHPASATPRGGAAAPGTGSLGGRASRLRPGTSVPARPPRPPRGSRWSSRRARGRHVPHRGRDGPPGSTRKPCGPARSGRHAPAGRRQDGPRRPRSGSRARPSTMRARPAPGRRPRRCRSSRPRRRTGARPGWRRRGRRRPTSTTTRRPTRCRRAWLWWTSGLRRRGCSRGWGSPSAAGPRESGRPRRRRGSVRRTAHACGGRRSG